MTKKFTTELNIFYKEHHEKCTHCGKLFIEGSTAHLGYLHNGKYAVLCDGCSHILRETVVRYYWMGDHFERPNPEDKLWRYMDLAKFISIICTKVLYFSAASSFDDPFEGAKGIAERKETWDDFYLDFFREAVLTDPGQNTSKLTSEKIESDAQRLLKDIDAYGVNSRNHKYISCWYSNEYESEAMWKIYSMNVSNAVAIQTTAEHLYLALNRSSYITIGKVKYIDYNKQYTPINGSFWFKRKAFEYENEVRAVITSAKNQGNGIGIPVDIDTLIDCIYISPYAPRWFENVVQSIVEKYSVSKPIRYSSMNELPFY